MVPTTDVGVSRVVSMPHSWSSPSMKSAVRYSWKLSSGFLWMCRRQSMISLSGTSNAPAGPGAGSAEGSKAIPSWMRGSVMGRVLV